MACEIKSGDILDLESINSNKKIYAGPGAGKTYFLINNIKEMFKRDTKIYGSMNKKILCSKSWLPNNHSFPTQGDHTSNYHILNKDLKRMKLY